jgi:RimK family alpha-L-glutamate ligase
LLRLNGEIKTVIFVLFFTHFYRVIFVFIFKKGIKMTSHTIGMWMYQNGGGSAIEQQLITNLYQRDIQVLPDLCLQQAEVRNGLLICKGIEMEYLDLYFSYNAGQQTPYQVYLYEILNMSVACINSFQAFALSEDKFKTTQLLHHYGIPTADYRLCRCDDFGSVQAVLNEWDGQAVYKPNDGWGGEGIVKVNNAADLEILLPQLNKADRCCLYLERLIDYDHTDFRIDIVDGEFVGCYGRKAPSNDWKTNITSGGSIMLREPNDEVVNLAIRAAKLSGLDIAGVDLIYDRQYQQYIVLEINGIPAFATPEQEKLGLNFNALKIEKIVNLIERRVKGKDNEHSAVREVA